MVFRVSMWQVRVNVLIMLFLAVLSLNGYAEEKQGSSVFQADPVSVIQTLSGDVIQLLAKHRDTFDTAPESFYTELEYLMEPVVAFSYIAKHVMGKQYYMSATEDQRLRFETRFKTGLIKTYARGFFSYTDEKINVYPYEPIEENARKTYIIQEISNNDGSTLLINYWMGRNKSNEWKLLNMVVNGINVGSILNSQFQQAMEQKGSLDKVIDDWAKPAETQDASVSKEKIVAEVSETN